MLRSVSLPEEVSKGLDRLGEVLQTLGFNGFYNTQLTTASMHLVRAKGKLVRPILVLLGSYCTNGIVASSINAAAAVELIHTASLIHDDLIDGDSIRRGVPTVHSLFGPQIAMLSGDMLISKAIEMSSDCGKRAVRELAKAAMDMCEGEAEDFEAQKSGRKSTFEEYVSMVHLKTASLLGSCAAIGGLVSECTDEQASVLREYGHSLGMAFQIRDDYLNVAGLQLDKPKSTGNDFAHNRPNIVAALNTEFDFDTSMEHAKEMNRKFVLKAIDAVKDAGERCDLLAGYAKLMLISPSDLQ